MRDFPAALAAKILRHHMQREDEPSHSPICCKQLLASKQSESYSSLLKDPKILKVFTELFSKKRLAEGTHPSPTNQNLNDELKFWEGRLPSGDENIYIDKKEEKMLKKIQKSIDKICRRWL